MIFLVLAEKYGGSLYTVSPDGGSLRDTGVAAQGSPAVSPDGKKIALVNYSCIDGCWISLDVMNTDGTGRHTLATNYNTRVTPDIQQTPSWTPDGTRILFAGIENSSSTTTTLLPPPPASRLWSIGADGTDLTRIEGFPDATQPRLSPDGTRVGFAKQHCSAQTGTCDKPQIYIGTADGTNVHALTHDSASDTSPVWSPDGARLVFSSDVGGTAAIWAINADGTGLNRLTTAPAGPPTAWG